MLIPFPLMGAYRREALQWKAGQLRSLIADKGYLQEHFHTLACATIDGVRVQAPANERRKCLGPCSLRQRSIERLFGYPIQVSGLLHNHPTLVAAGGQHA